MVFKIGGTTVIDNSGNHITASSNSGSARRIFWYFNLISSPFEVSPSYSCSKSYNAS